MADLEKMTLDMARQALQRPLVFCNDEQVIAIDFMNRAEYALKLLQDSYSERHGAVEFCSTCDQLYDFAADYPNILEAAKQLLRERNNKP